MIQFILKARGYMTGTVRKRKGGQFLKTAPHQWKLLHEHVAAQNKAAGHHENKAVSKQAHEAAVALVKHLDQQPHPKDKEVAHQFLDEMFDVPGHKNASYQAFKHRVIRATHAYLDARQQPEELAKPVKKKPQFKVVGNPTEQRWGKVVAEHESESSPGTFHQVRHHKGHGTFSCNCKGWSVHRKCWHCEQAAKKKGLKYRPSSGHLENEYD